MDPLSMIGQLAGKVFGGGSLPPGGASPLGDFDATQFVNANLSKFENNKDSQVGSVVRGGLHLLGIGKDSQLGTQTTTVAPTGNLDYLGSVLQSLNQGQ